VSPGAALRECVCGLGRLWFTTLECHLNSMLLLNRAPWPALRRPGQITASTFCSEIASHCVVWMQQAIQLFLRVSLAQGGKGFSAHFGQQRWLVSRQPALWAILPVMAGIFEGFRHGYAGGGSSFGFPRARPAPGITTSPECASFPHDARAPLADRGEHLQHGGADLQENLPAVAHDLARGLKQPPERSHPLPSASERKPRYRL
jgi:hypothetical protein